MEQDVTHEGVPEHLHQKMAEFFARTSAPRILARQEKEKLEKEKEELAHA
ncbi:MULTISPECIES: hypothetical protein [Listeria]|uniref:Uncharacterized protein n=1 Tax=Listeria rustica TaxID=2713503 RepID=A0A7W1YGE5_9LIST|nr:MULTISPECIES: hypothetical protein [Listeria]KMT62699.1 hypothetical protein X559_0982 [Listeria newyorkensis]MBA3926582.1 hypothetical protein [Listeria rustica]